MAFDSQEFGERLRKLRTDKHMSQQELADELGIALIIRHNFIVYVLNPTPTSP